MSKNSKSPASAGASKQTSAKASACKKKMAPKQVAAIIGIVLLVAIYLITLIVAFVHPVASGKLFALCLFATLAVPILIWIYVWMYGKMTGKRTFADFDAGVAEDVGSEN